MSRSLLSNLSQSSHFDRTSAPVMTDHPQSVGQPEEEAQVSYACSGTPHYGLHSWDVAALEQCWARARGRAAWLATGMFPNLECKEEEVCRVCCGTS